MRVSGNSRSSMSKSFGLDSSKMDSTERRHSSDTSEVERLRKQIISYKAVIQQQEDLIQVMCRFKLCLMLNKHQ